MKKLILIIGLFLLTACTLNEIANPIDKKKPAINDISLSDQILQSLEGGHNIQYEAIDGQQNYPDDVNPMQVADFFRLDDLYFALYRRSSINENIQASNANSGVLIKQNEEGWGKWLTVKDSGSAAGNNPYYLWSEQGNLYLLAADATGAGSGEGIAKVFQSADGGKNWEMTRCFYWVGPEFNQEYLDKNKNLTHSDIERYLEDYRGRIMPLEYETSSKECRNVRIKNESPFH